MISAMKKLKKKPKKQHAYYIEKGINTIFTNIFIKSIEIILGPKLLSADIYRFDFYNVNQVSSKERECLIKSEWESVFKNLKSLNIFVCLISRWINS